MNLHPPSKRVCTRAVAIILSFAFFVILLQWPSARAETFFSVTHNGDTPDVFIGNGKCEDSGGLCTLRAAIQEANALPGDDHISIQMTGTINLTGPLPTITSNISIVGPGTAFGALIIRRNTGGDYRIFTIDGGNVEIFGLTVANGKTPDGTPGLVTGATAAWGGGILVQSGSLELTGVTIEGNRTGNGGVASETNSSGGWGGAGGGLASLGTLTMKNCRVTGNTTGTGGGGGFGGSGGFGGGLLISGRATLTNVVVDGNTTGDGATGTTAGLNGGSGGPGGGIFVQSDSLVENTLSNLTVTNNVTGNAARGNAGDGGGIYFSTGKWTVRNSIISNNRTGNGTGGLAFSGFGGGIANSAIVTIRESTISGNVTGSNGPSGTGGGGGGIRNTSLLNLINSTVSGNTIGASDSQGRTNAGGGISNWATMTITNCTITLNSAFGNNISGVSGNFNDTNTTTIGNTIIAQNGTAGAEEVDGPFASLGHNLIGNADGATGFVAGDLVGTTITPLNAMLGPLTDDGDTKSHPLLTGSPALDAGDNALAKDSNNNALATDQRGAVRIADSPDADTTATVDIGAWEFLSALEDITDKVMLEDTIFSFTFGLGDSAPSVTSVTASSSNQDLVPASESGLEFSGTGRARTLTIHTHMGRSGSTVITVTVNLSGGGVLTDTFTLTVFEVNDRPSFLMVSSDAVLEDSGARTAQNFATSIDSGFLEEPQSLSFEITSNNNPSLFSVAPAISSSGTLTYTPAPNAQGRAVLTVVLKDNGGTANGGQDTSEPATFTIAVIPVNDVPTFTKGADQVVNEDTGFQTVSNWATGVSAGPNESGQVLTFVVTNNTNPGLFSTQPFIRVFDLSLNYMPAPHAHGSAEITVVLKDDGGSADGGVNTTAPQTFTITVTSINDAPFHVVPFNPSTNQQAPLTFSTSTFNAISVVDVDAGTDPIRVSLTATQGTLSVGSTSGLGFVAGDGVDDLAMTFTGTVAAINSSLNGLTFKPDTGFSGTATLQIISDDQGHHGSGGAKSSTTNVNILVRSGGRLVFNTAVYGVNETGGTATITVLRGSGNAGTATVNYSTSNGTATAGTSCSSGVDYLGTSGTLSWANGDTSARTFTITICNDGSNEDDETISLTLSNAGGTGSLGPQSTATLTIGNDDGPALLVEAFTDHAIALDLVTQIRDPLSLLSPFNLSTDQRRRVSLFIWHLGLLPGDDVSSVKVVARDDEGRVYDLAVEALVPMMVVSDVTQVVIRLPDDVIGAPRDLRVKVTLRGPGTNEAIIRIAAP